jgi:hypothetical protein
MDLEKALQQGRDLMDISQRVLGTTKEERIVRLNKPLQRHAAALEKAAFRVKAWYEEERDKYILHDAPPQDKAAAFDNVLDACPGGVTYRGGRGNAPAERWPSFSLDAVVSQIDPAYRQHAGGLVAPLQICYDAAGWGEPYGSEASFSTATPYVEVKVFAEGQVIASGKIGRTQIVSAYFDRILELTGPAPTDWKNATAAGVAELLSKVNDTYMALARANFEQSDRAKTIAWLRVADTHAADASLARYLDEMTANRQVLDAALSWGMPASLDRRADLAEGIRSGSSQRILDAALVRDFFACAKATAECTEQGLAFFREVQRLGFAESSQARQTRMKTALETAIAHDDLRQSDRQVLGAIIALEEVAAGRPSRWIWLFWVFGLALIVAAMWALAPRVAALASHLRPRSWAR